MITALTALLVLVVLAVAVTVMDAVRAAHWRSVAVERRWSWHDRLEDDATA